MRKLLIIIALNYNVLSAQKFLNGSFEANSFVDTRWNMSNKDFNSKMSDVKAFGPKGSMDVINSSYSYGAQDGNWYIGMEYEKIDLISMRLDTSLITGRKYILTYYDLARKANRKKFDLDFGLSEKSTEFGDKIYDTLTGTCYSHWMKYSLTFTAPNNGRYITIKLTEKDSWICFDNFSLECAYEDIIELGNDVLACEGQLVYLNSYIKGGDYLWQDGSRLSTFTALDSGKYWVKVKAYNCVETDTIKVSYIEYPEIELGKDSLICEGQSIRLSSGIEGFKHLWSDGSRQEKIEVNRAGKYWVAVTNVNCTSSDTIEIFSKELPVLELGNDTSICRGQTLTIFLDPSEANYLWGDGSDKASYVIDKEGIYVVTATKNGCIDRDSVEISIAEYPVADLGRDTTICKDIPLILNMSKEFNIQWDDGSHSNSIEVSDEGSIWVEFEKQGCKSSDTINILTKDCNPSLQMPNVFTPNNDGLNDEWHPIYLNLVQELLIEVFDRSGGMVYSTNDVEFEWNGLLPDGRPALNAIYFYILDYTPANGQRMNENGMVTLLR